ncbi:hypothetical protein CH362_18635 [Leptospira saintgironsiae]|uniref:Uncharacterized protein n=2 Tax=Leptospira saintgironsiae TaxID=2023183 RepID=A0A2M9Y7R8_9LEPT|nr:hypothetical protein CH362_18635 [Leptospira saintgironsiae]
MSLQKNWLKKTILPHIFIPQDINQRRRKKEYMNESFRIIQEAKLIQKKYSKLIIELDRNDNFWSSKATPNYKKQREKNYNYIAKIIWFSFEDDKWLNINSIIQSRSLPRITVYRIVRAWSRLGIARITDKPSITHWEKTRYIRIKKVLSDLPNLLYSINGISDNSQGG